MDTPRPSVARILSLIAATIFGTLVAVVLAEILVTFWITYRNHSSSDFWSVLMSDVRGFPEVVVVFCLGTLIGSPLTLRLGRISQLWPAALLAAAAVGLTAFLMVTERLHLVERWIIDLFLPAGRLQLTWALLIAFAQVLNTAVLCLLCRLGSRYFRRAHTSEDPSPDAPVIADRRRHFGTRAELGTFVLMTAGILLFIVGIDLAIGALFVRQIPPAIWDRLQNPKELTFLAVQTPTPQAGQIFHDRQIIQEVAMPTAGHRAAIIACLKRGLRDWRNRKPGTSVSEYGLRATGGETTLDLLISFKHGNIAIFEDSTEKMRVMMHGSPTEFDAFVQTKGAPHGAP